MASRSNSWRGRQSCAAIWSKRQGNSCGGSAGDVAARVAHEVRNPVPAMLVTMGKLCEELIAGDKRQRVDQMIRERSFIPQGGGDCYR